MDIKLENLIAIHKIKFQEVTEQMVKQGGEYARGFPVGSILKESDGSIYLVGDVNEILGVCDDCTACRPEEIVGIASITDMIKDEWK